MSRTHGRPLSSEITKRLRYPHISTLSNDMEEDGNMIVLQRVVHVLIIKRVLMNVDSLLY